jgi:ABC-type transport system substrate-binding protein
MAYLAKGVDFDEDGMFEPTSEYNVWGEQSTTTTPLELTVYYDFNGAYWHDGTQMTPWDLFFSYHLHAFCGRCITSLRQLLPGGMTSSYDPSRQLNILPFDSNPGTAGVQHSWEGEGTMAGDPNLRMAVTYTLTEPYFQFYDDTLAIIADPMHVWSRTGGSAHVDFGCAVWVPPAEAADKGIPECGSTDEAKWGRGIDATESVPGSTPFRFTGGTGAEAWSPTDDQVIGSGPFLFDTWVPGVESRVTRYEHYFVGWDTKFTDTPTDDILMDAALASIMKKPTIDSIRFLVYKTTQLGVFALQSNEIDFYHWNVEAEFVPDLVKVPEIAISSKVELGFSYLAYNMRDAPWGYENDSPANDVGYGFRQAVSHMIDKRSVVQNVLQNYGVIGHATVSPANTFWHNSNIPTPGYDLAAARAILDDLATPGGAYFDSRYSLDPAGPCHKDNEAGCRSLPGIGSQVFEILTPLTYPGHPRSEAGAMIADAMRQVGLNVRTTSVFPLFQPPCQRNFDLLLLGWQIAGADPDYLFSFFHSSNAPCGQNYPGVRNATLDAVLDASQREMNRTVRRQLIHEAQRLLADIRPYEVLYHRPNIEPYRRDRFVDWTVMGGTIWNGWSLLSIRPPTEQSLRLHAEAPLQLTAGSDSPIDIRVRDARGLAAPYASLAVEVLSISGDPGALIANGTRARSLNLTANADGSALLLYRAPTDVTGNRQVRLLIAASLPEFAPVSWESTLDVFPMAQRYLRATIDFPAGDLTRPGGAIPMRITVVDNEGRPAPQARVTIETSDPASLRPDAVFGDAATLRETALHADSLIAGETTFTITVRASMDGLADAVVVTHASVVPESRTKLCPDLSRAPVEAPCPEVSSAPAGAPFVTAAMSVAILVATAVALAFLRKSRR